MKHTITTIKKAMEEDADLVIAEIQGMEMELREQLRLAELKVEAWKIDPDVRQVWIAVARTYKEILG